MIDVSVTQCKDYITGYISKALTNVLLPLGGLDFVRPGMTVGIKVNLVAAMKPETAATTHPALVCELVRMLRERGAEVIVGDSPGGLYTQAFVSRVYQVSGMREVEKYGAKLNDDFSQTHTEYPGAKVLKNFTYTSWLDRCDAIINFCKMKSHGMMGMSAAAKNMFGAIPGTTKPEYHFRFPNYKDFSDMIIDIDEYFHPILSICDAIEGMEGNGPTQGMPRHIGLLFASASPHKLDLAAARIIGLEASDVPTLCAAQSRGLIPDNADKMKYSSPISDFIIPDYQVVKPSGLLFDGKSRFVGKLVKTALASRPVLHSSECIGCGQCAHICPAHAIEIRKKKAHIDRSQCIRCFCCQEFCPKGAMKVHRTLIARIINK